MSTSSSSTFTHSHAVQKQNSTSLSINPVQQPLASKEIERICKAFIRLLDAPLITKGVQDDGKQTC